MKWLPVLIGPAILGTMFALWNWEIWRDRKRMEAKHKAKMALPPGE